MRSTLLRLFLYALWVLLVALATTAEGHLEGTASRYGEASIVEYLQTAFLLAVTGLFAYAARTFEHWRGVCPALALIALVATIREQDSFFDHNVFDGFWQLLALAVLAWLGWFLWRYPGPLAREVREFAASSSAGLLVAGFVTVFVYSRIIGMQTLWRGILGDGYVRVAKNFVEEGTELFGYSLLVVAAVETVVQLRARRAPVTLANEP
ncbi:MAG: hypothetical protein FJ197_00110 [Gammaproteobacteria bacterium]|nr:hypothetical protein [Gammaproteobacteria bacterium]